MPGAVERNVENPNAIRKRPRRSLIDQLLAECPFAYLPYLELTSWKAIRRDNEVEDYLAAVGSLFFSIEPLEPLAAKIFA